MHREHDHQEFAKAVSALFVAFRAEATKLHLEAYWIGLSDLTVEQLKQAVSRAIRESDRLPTPSELRRLCGVLVDDDTKAIAAWGDVQRAIRLGPYKHIDFQDKLINAAIRNLGGWPTFVSRFTDAESEKWVRFEFTKAYRNLANSKVSGESILPLPGLNQVQLVDGELQDPVPIAIPCCEERRMLVDVGKPLIPIGLEVIKQPG